MDRAVGEPRLAGIWTYGGEDDTRKDILHVIPLDNGDRSFDIVFLDHADRDWAVLSGYVTAVGGRRFVNLQLRAASDGLMADVDTQKGNGSQSYSFVAYAFEGNDILRLGFPREALYKAVAEGRLAGETSGDYDVFVSAGSPEIAAFLGSVDAAELFAEAHRYRRTQLPDRP